MGLPVFVLVGAIVLAEKIFTPAFAPSAIFMLAAVAGLMYKHEVVRKKQNNESSGEAVKKIA
jgi:hypothetical protein